MALPPAPFPWTFRPGCPSYATFDRPPYSRLVVMVRGTPHISSVAPHFASFGEVEEIWGAHTDLNHCLQGPVFVKFARSSQALRALEAFRGAPLLAFPRFDQMYLAQSRVPGKPYELDTDLQKLTVIHVAVPRSFTENVLANKFKVYGVIVSCVIIRIEFGKSKDLGYVGFSVPSEAALAIEECDKSFEAVWAEAEPDPPKHPFLRFGVYGAQQRTAKHEIQGATLNTMCKNTSLANDVKQPSKVSESKSPVNNSKQKTPCNEAQESSVDTLGKSTSLAKVTEPSKLSASKSDVNNSKSKTTNNEVQKSSVHTSGKDAKWVKSAMKPEVRSESKFPVNNPKHQTTSSDIQGSKLNTFSKDTKWIKSAMKPVAPSESKSSVNNPKHKTTSNEVEVSRSNSLGKCTKSEQQTTSSSMICTENKKTGRRTKWDQLPTSSSVICTEIMQWSNLIPVVSRITLNVPVTRTESEPGGKEQNAITHRTPGSNLILLGSVDNDTSSEPAVTARESSVNYWVNHTKDYHTSEVQKVLKPPEHSEYKYYVDGTDYSAALSEPSMQSPGSSSDYYYYTSGVEQQTDDHGVKESNVTTSEVLRSYKYE
nr:uncharacterized protein LOC132767826 [Anolis sagrei ordinatus]